MELYKNDKLFKESIGAFIIASSEMEFAITSLCSILGEDPRLHQNQFLEIFGIPLNNKRKLIREFIKTHLPDLLKEWIEINVSIGELMQTGDIWFMDLRNTICLTNILKLTLIKTFE